MWLSISIISLSDDTNRLTLGVWKVSFVVESNMADLSSIWASESLVEDNFTNLRILWLECVIWD